VLALDVGTSSLRAILYDALGRHVQGAERHTPYQMSILVDSGVEMDADELVGMTCRSIDAALQGAGRSHRNWGGGLFDLLA
jgi:gluconokinase